MQPITTSLEISKELYEKWFRKESYFILQDYKGNWDFRLDTSEYWNHKTVPSTYISYPSYLSDELLMWLPAILTKRWIWLVIDKELEWYSVSYMLDEDYYFTQKSESLPDALARMVIYLLWEWLITN